ncbi:hypothetical protein GCM10007385_01000 [Tateyamaria omphalii]|nr:hypothetical protein GCM10007385_01000 [Tateyamaria omphalii]
MTIALPNLRKDTILNLDRDGTENSIVHQLILCLNRPSATSLPVSEIVNTFQRQGKHFVPKEVLLLLSRIRDKLSESDDGTDGWTIAFLDVLLDKADQTYDYHSYLALKVLFWGDEHRIDETALDENILALLLDLLDFETAAPNQAVRWLDRLPADAELLDLRCQRILKLVQRPAERLGIWPSTKDLSAPQLSHLLLELFDRRCPPTTNARLHHTILPVATVHDEYMFIRVLQTFETVFRWLARVLQRVIDLDTDNIDLSTHLMRRCSVRLNEVQFLLTLLSSMRKEAFADFRRFTEGASAIQSHSYKLIEALCRTPDPDRLNSAAFQAVPGLKPILSSQTSTLDQVLERMKHSIAISDTKFEAFKDSATEFETAVLRWRKFHHKLAVSMLGKTTGTGYTEGASYLDKVKDAPLLLATTSRRGSG